MKKRWMKSVVEASKQDIPAMPFERGRCARCSGCEKPAAQTARKVA